MLKYEMRKVSVPEKYHQRIKDAISHNQAVPVKIDLNKPGDQEVLMTPGQVAKMERAYRNGRKCVTIRMTQKQLQHNLKHEGGFLSILASLAGKVLPTLLSGLASGLIAGGVEKMVSGSGLYLSRRGGTCQIEILDDGLKLTPSEYEGIDGLYAKNDSEIIGSGLLLGKNSPFRDIPLLGLIL